MFTLKMQFIDHNHYKINLDDYTNLDFEGQCS